MHTDANYQKSINELLELYSKKKFIEVEEELKKIIKLYPTEAFLENLYGIICSVKNENINAISHFERATVLDKNFPDAFYNLGSIYAKILDSHNAIKNFKKAIYLKKDYFDACFNLANIYKTNYQFEEAIYYYLRCNEIRDNDVEVYNSLASIYLKLDNVVKAETFINKALKFNNIETFCIYSSILIEQKKYDEARSNLDKALILEPDYFRVYYLLGILFHKQNNFINAEKYYLKSIKYNSNYFESYFALGALYSDLDNFEKSLEFYKKSIQLNKFFYQAYWNESLVKLKLEHYDGTWEQYDYRWKSHKSPNKIYDLNKDLWNGQYLDGTLLVWSEQGLGEHIFFGRMIPFLKNYAKNIIFEVDKRVVNLFKIFFREINCNNVSVIETTNKKSCSNFDKHIPSGSIAKFVFNKNNNIKEFYKNNLNLNNFKQDEIKNYLSIFKKPKIGISWKSLNKEEQHRSVGLENFSKIFKNNKYDFFNLQFGDTLKEVADVENKFQIKINQPKDIDNFNDIESLCSLINNLDLVITVQNTNAHLSMWLKQNTFVILPINCRWQWGIKSVSAWYPDAKIFRQTRFNYWDDVIQNLDIELKNKLE